QVMELINELRKAFNLTVLMVTHDLEVADYADRVLTLRDGALGQDLSGTEEEGLKFDESGRVYLPDGARSHLTEAARIAVEVRPEGVLLRPEAAESDDTEALLQEMLPQDAPPARRGLLARLRRRRQDNRYSA